VSKDLTKEINVLRKALQEDEGYYYAWQANIAVAFQDAMNHAGYKFPDLHKISNDAAKMFLTNLIGFSGEVNKKLLERQ